MRSSVLEEMIRSKKNIIAENRSDPTVSEVISVRKTEWQTIEARPGWRMINFGELWRYRDLFYFLTLRDIKARYAQSVLGIGWAVIQPLVMMVVFSVIFGRVAKLDSDGAPYPIFAYVALVPWTYF